MGNAKLAIGLVGLFVVGIASAQQSAPRPQSANEVLKSVQPSANDIQQLRANLQSPDPSVRVATFTAMVQSNNPSLITIAINEAHASADATLRDLSVRAAFRQLLNFLLEPDGDVDPDLQSGYMVFATNNLHPKIEKYDWVNGLFTIYGGEGQITGTRLTFKSGYCQGSLAAVEGTWTYQGQVICLNGNQKYHGKMHVNLR